MKKIALLMTSFALPAMAFADSPYLPIPNSTQVTLGYVTQSADNFWIVEKETKLPSTVKYDNIVLSLQHGLTDTIALDGTATYTKVTFDADPTLEETKLADSKIGIRYRLADEYETLGSPTVAVRLGAIIKGNYTTNKMVSIGDGGNGYEFSVLAGKNLMKRLNVSGELGFRDRNRDIPNEFFYNLDLGLALSSKLSLGLGYNIVRSQGSLDIGAPSFSPQRFQELKENRDFAKASINYRITPSTNVGLQYGKVLSGRNATELDAVGVTVSHQF